MRLGEKRSILWGKMNSNWVIVGFREEVVFKKTEVLRKTESTLKCEDIVKFIILINDINGLYWLYTYQGSRAG